MFESEKPKNKHKYYLLNRELFISRAKKNYENNKESKKEYSRLNYRKNKNNPEWLAKRKAYAKKYRSENLHKKRIFINNLKRTNPNYRLRENMSTQIWFAIKNKKAGRKWETLVGYSINELIKYLESKFHLDKNICWDNYGTYWHIDHIKPKSLFDFTNEEDIKRCWALSNLQPLEAIENKKKYTKYSI